MRGFLVCMLVGLVFLGSVIGVCAGFHAAFGAQGGQVLLATLAAFVVTFVLGFFICSIFENNRLIKILARWATE